MEHPLEVLLLGAFLCVILQGCLALRDVKIDVPAAVVQGEKAVLKCIFDLEGDKLYSVKWYRGAGEFYRYTPNDSQPIKQFKIRGFNVLESESNATQVVLDHVSRINSGAFSCEVTADQPSFFTDMKTADLEVVVLPDGDPVITGLKKRYRINETLLANCTLKRTIPAAELAWHINGHRMKDANIRSYRHSDGEYFTSTSVLRMIISKDHFLNGKLKVRCSASILKIYHRSAEKSLVIERGRHKPTYAWETITISTTTTPGYPQEKWLYVEANAQSPPPDTTLFFFPSFNTAMSRQPYGAILLVSLSLLLLVSHR